MMAKMEMEGEDCRAKSVCDPCSGTGRLLLAASNYSMRLYGVDINRTVIKASLINGYLYAPWLVRPLPFLDTAPEPVIDLETVTPDWEPETSAPQKPQLELILA